MSQSVTLPDDLHQPTLSFVYAADAWPTSSQSPPFAVSVESTITVTQIFSASLAPDGDQLGWADLAPWAGQTITITFGLAPTTEPGETMVYLDHVTLAPWLTPVLESVTPSVAALGATTPITITGQNFLDGATVQLRMGAKTATPAAVAWVDAQTLTADVPALGPGLYDLWVTNPGGQQGMRVGAVAVGRQNFIPLIAR